MSSPPRFSYFDTGSESNAVKRASIEVVGAGVVLVLQRDQLQDAFVCRYRRLSEVPWLSLPVLLAVSLLPAQYSRYSFLQDPRLPSLTSLDEWRRWLGQSP
jgi:hypothetical protein